MKHKQGNCSRTSPPHEYTALTQHGNREGRGGGVKTIVMIVDATTVRLLWTLNPTQMRSCCRKPCKPVRTLEHLSVVKENSRPPEFAQVVLECVVN